MNNGYVGCADDGDGWTRGYARIRQTARGSARTEGAKDLPTAAQCRDVSSFKEHCSQAKGLLEANSFDFEREEDYQFDREDPNYNTADANRFAYDGQEGLKRIAEAGKRDDENQEYLTIK